VAVKPWREQFDEPSDVIGIRPGVQGASTGQANASDVGVIGELR
jgi:hypothetical protein